MAFKGKWKLKLMKFGFKCFIFDLLWYVKSVYILEWCYCDDNLVLYFLNGKWINYFYILIGLDYDLKG